MYTTVYCISIYIYIYKYTVYLYIYILFISIYCIYTYIYTSIHLYMAYRSVNFFSDSLGAGGRAYIYWRHIFRWGNFKVEMLVSTQFFQRLSICILGRCSLQEMANYSIIFTFFWWCKGALYSRNSSLWLLRSWKLTGWLKSPEICRGRRGVKGLPVQKKLRDSAEWFFLAIFWTLLFQTWIYIRAAYYGLNSNDYSLEFQSYFI